MRSNSPFRQDKCATGWAKLKEGYLKKEGGAEEYKKEKTEYHCNESTDYKVKLKSTDDAEQQNFITKKKTSMAEQKQQSK
jgi:membrane-bound inhibitor of C-type lysozyme